MCHLILRLAGRATRGRRRHRQEGFTLIEVMVVTAIMLIIMATAVPSGVQRLKSRSVKSAAGELQYQLQRAKLLAVKEGADVSLAVDIDANEYYLETAESGRVTTIGLSRDVVFSDDWTNSALVTFTPSGVAFRSGAFYLTDPEDLRTVRLRVTDAGGISMHLYSKASNKWTQY